MQLPVHLVHDRSQIAVEPDETPAKLFDDGKEPVKAAPGLSPMLGGTARAKLHGEVVHEMLSARGHVGGGTKSIQEGMGRCYAIENCVHLRHVGANRSRAL